MTKDNGQDYNFDLCDFIAVNTIGWIDNILSSDVIGIPSKYIVAVCSDPNSITEKEEDEALKNWKSTLESIRDGFVASQLIIDYAHRMDDASYQSAMEDFNRGMNLLKENFFYLWE